MRWRKADAARCCALEDYFEAAFVVLNDAAFELTRLESSRELESSLMSWKAMMSFDESETTVRRPDPSVCTSNELNEWKMKAIKMCHHNLVKCVELTHLIWYTLWRGKCSFVEQLFRRVAGLLALQVSIWYWRLK